ncbi:MAG TPA: stage II sporulation protein M, partial [Gemmatimonadales bacterium]
HLELETPEHVVLDYEIAGVGSRTLAALADWLIVLAMLIVAVLAIGLLRGGAPWLVVIDIVILYGVVWGYFTLFEGLRNGQTPGKRWLGIRVIRDTGHGIGIAEAAARNLLLPVDLFGMIGIILIAVHPRARRLGDLVAGTVVVRDRPFVRQVSAIAPATPLAEAPAAGQGTPSLTDQEFLLLSGFIERSPTLPPPVRDRFAASLAARFAERNPLRPGDDLLFVTTLYREEEARRGGRFGARGPGPAGRTSSGAVAARLVARKSARWAEFQVIADRVSAGGLDVLAARELPDFAARYREVAADLARARTYHADSMVLTQLERLVAAGHSALYRIERHTWRRIGAFISAECPAAIVASWRYVLLAFLVFTLPGLAGYELLRQHPDLAAEVIPDNMLDRAEAGAARQAHGQGYVMTLPSQRPIVAASIITNNIGVAFTCFAWGIVFGVGSLIAVGFNGLILGAISGYFANMGLLGYLWTFVAGHGVLELFSIWVAGAAGLMLGRAIIAPGELPRRDALVLAGRTAMRMIAAVVVMLICAGTIEGFISSGTSSLAVRLCITAGTTMLLVAYLFNGARHLGVRTATPGVYARDSARRPLGRE